MASLSGNRDHRPPLAVAEVSFRLTSPAFADLGELPHRCAAASPPLAWTAPPAGTRTLAVMGELWDRPPAAAEAPTGVLPGRTVWLGWGIAPASGGLGEGQEPCFPGVRYGGFPTGQDERALLFSLLALDSIPLLLPGAFRPAFDRAVSGHVLGIATLVARRPDSWRWPRRLRGR